MSILQFASEMFRRYPMLYLGNTVLAVLLMAVDAATLFSIAPVVGVLTEGGTQGSITPVISDFVNFFGLDNTVETFLSIFVVLTITNSLMLIVINYFVLKTQFIVRKDMVLGTSSLIFYTSPSYITKQHQGDFLNTLTQEVNRVSDAFTAMTRLIAPTAQVAILLTIPLAISWEVTTISLGLAVVLVLPIKLSKKYVYKFGQDHTSLSNSFFGALQENLSNTRVITTFANEEKTINKLDRVFSKLRDVSLKYQVLNSTIQSIFAPIGVILVFITFLVGKYYGVVLAEVAVILYAFNRLSGVVGQIVQYRMQLVNLYPSYEQVMKVRCEAKENKLQFGNKKIENLTHGIELQNVSFSYDRDTAAVQNVNFQVPAKKMTALVGASGSGKSTLADLIMGMQQPSSGNIYIDNVSLEEIDMSSYRNMLGYVPQQTALFNSSIRDNIQWANEQATEKEIMDVCRLAHAEGFIAELPEGMDTIVGDRGVRLSGGQVQRIAMARALIRNPQILVLDEATSALDSQSEKYIQSFIESILGETTILVIAHRLSTIAKADNIVVLDKGRIVEQGSYDELMANKQVFANLVKLQSLKQDTL